MSIKNGKQTLAKQIHDLLVGKRCWYVSCGGAAASTFELALGEKKPREHPLANVKHEEEFRNFEGEANLLVWCTWRLDNANGPVSSSDDAVEHIQAELVRLRGAAIADVKVELPGWDLQIAFVNDLTLRIFCDHLPGDPSFDGNWELWLPDKTITIDVGSVCQVEERVKETSS